LRLAVPHPRLGIDRGDKILFEKTFKLSKSGVKMSIRERWFNLGCQTETLISLGGREKLHKSESMRGMVQM